MSELKIALVHAGEREERGGHDGHQGLGAVPGRRDVIAARVNGALKDLAYELQDGDEVEGVAIDSPDGHDILRHSTAHVMAQAVQDLYPDARLGIGPPIQDGFYYDFDVETPFVPEDLEKIETRMRKIIKEGQRFSRRVTTDGDALSELKDEPYKVELIGLKGAGKAEDAGGDEGASRRGGRRRADHLRQHPPRRRGRLERPVPRPAPADHQADPGVQADAHRRGVLARRREEQAAPAHLRHRLGVARRRSRSTCTGSRRPSAATTASSAATSTSTPSPTSSAPASSVFHPKGGVIKREMEDYVRRRHIEEGFEYVGTPHISKEGLFHTSGPPALLRRRHVPADGVRGRELLPQGDELPDAQPDLPVARPLLPRAAAAALRVRRRLPLREVRRRARPDPGPRA